jgi:hypothetical protein
MRIDWYTKGVLTVIAVLLAVIALKQYVSPDAVAQAQGTFAGVLPMGDITNVVSFSGGFFDTRSGEIWVYIDGKLYHKFQLTKLGQPVVKDK